ncbi:MAG TPA: 2Fe-2S iron-sulfur cluster-binding protein [Novosphingobium sp.]|mgnify:CR=1 FL=1|nr:2Fe-2S iron-sulfur cluster-binding protein [Novosphingobium sp.]HMP55581.1 2Fe-2S iron-sulfur cluster-binding protein [Novosphingobium sp.]
MTRADLLESGTTATIAVRFIEPDGTRREIHDARTGMSLMEVARSHGIAGMAGDCGGACACATCHVHVAAAFMALVGPPDEVEAEMLDMVSHVARETSRLGCQIRLSTALDGLEVAVAAEA